MESEDLPRYCSEQVILLWATLPSFVTDNTAVKKELRRERRSKGKTNKQTNKEKKQTEHREYSEVGG